MQFRAETQRIVEDKAVRLREKRRLSLIRQAADRKRREIAKVQYM